MENEKAKLNEISRNRIKEARKLRKMTLEQVARACDVQKSTVRKWEEGMIATVKFDHMECMAKAFNVSLAWLLGMNVPMQIEESEHKNLRNELADKLMFLSIDELKKLKILIETMFDG